MMFPVHHDSLELGDRPMRWFILSGLVALTLLVGLDSSAFAAITGTGDVSPSDPNTWTLSTDALIGDTSSGTVTADGGSLLLSRHPTIGNASGGSGQVSISGTGTTWNNSGYLDVGYSGSGHLTIASGGSVSNVNGYIGHYGGSDGTVMVDGAGSHVSALPDVLEPAKASVGSVVAAE